MLKLQRSVVLVTGKTLGSHKQKQRVSRSFVSDEPVKRRTPKAAIFEELVRL